MNEWQDLQVRIYKEMLLRYGVACSFSVTFEDNRIVVEIGPIVFFHTPGADILVELYRAIEDYAEATVLNLEFVDEVFTFVGLGHLIEDGEFDFFVKELKDAMISKVFGL